MKKMTSLLLLLIFCLVAPCFANEKTDEPLTLLKQPQKNSQAQQQPVMPSQNIQLHDIEGPVPFHVAPPYLLIAGVILALLVVLAAIFWLLKMRKKPGPPPIPPWEKALAELAEARKLFNTKQSLIYVERVSQILRSYIESRFTIRSTRQTTREFLQEMNKTTASNPLQESRVELQACFEQADMAKFAHRIPGQENMEEMIRRQFGEDYVDPYTNSEKVE